MNKLEKKKSKKKLKKTRKILWDETYGEQPIMHALGDTGHPHADDWR